MAGTGGALTAPGENPAVAGPAGPSMGPYGAHHASGNTLARELPVCPSCRLPGCSEASPETGGRIRRWPDRRGEHGPMRSSPCFWKYVSRSTRSTSHVCIICTVCLVRS